MSWGTYLFWIEYKDYYLTALYSALNNIAMSDILLEVKKEIYACVYDDILSIVYPHKCAYGLRCVVLCVGLWAWQQSLALIYIRVNFMALEHSTIVPVPVKEQYRYIDNAQ